MGNRKSMVKALLTLCLLLVAYIGFTLTNGGSELAVSQPQTDIAVRTPEESETISVYKQTSLSVVFITTISLTVDPFDFFGSVQPRQGSGSGIIIDAKKGIIVTNLHVIQDAKKIEITLPDGGNYGAKLLGTDSEYDIALLQLRSPPAGLTALPFGDSSVLEVGQRVLAIGNPFGLDRTLTTGIISSLNRTVRGNENRLMKGLIQTDAAINPGNSGGPLLDMNGRLIGINSAILSQSGDSAGIGFAVPINQVKTIIPDLLDHGKVLRPKFGWVLVDTTQGPMVRRVDPDGPAESAGLSPVERFVENAFMRGFVRDITKADLIVAINGTPVKNKDEIEELLSHVKADSTVKLTVRQGGQQGTEREVKLTPVLG